MKTMRKREVPRAGADRKTILRFAPPSDTMLTARGATLAVTNATMYSNAMKVVEEASNVAIATTSTMTSSIVQPSITGEPFSVRQNPIDKTTAPAIPKANPTAWGPFGAQDVGSSTDSVQPTVKKKAPTFCDHDRDAVVTGLVHM